MHRTNENPSQSDVQRMCRTFQISYSDVTNMARIFHPLLALIASATDRELAKCVEYLKQENRILRARILCRNPRRT
ncbi:hypothetical protein Pan189_19660 [Stratiformator vulcanicus]|uniref:Uncharacterized protein n=1 Tax=Stratiformator vulcanicus TaxID=2527980 RepID=A0A517R151_9PLAN|nr:hypothetical protein Pan189_19660 [Stratiformator vulcanicus]